jgi:hypothetical protein
MSSASLKKHQNWGWMRHVLTTLSSVLFVSQRSVIALVAVILRHILNFTNSYQLDLI